MPIDWPAITNGDNYVNALINQRAIGEELNSGNFRTVIERSRRSNVSMRRAQVAARNAYTNLLNEHVRQAANSDASSINDAMNERNAAIIGINNTDLRLQQLQAHLNSPPVPMNNAGIRKVRANWLPSEIFRSWRRAQDQATILPPATITPDVGPLLGRWDFHRQVGTGGQGTASLWLGFNMNNQVSRRIVRKTVDESKNWHDTRKFAGADARNVNNRIPWELECHEEMMRAQQPANNNLTPNRHIVALGAPANTALVNNVTKMYRIYTEWCPRGDLDSIITHYRGMLPRRPIPEPFIWAVAEALTSAGVAMQTGDEGGLNLPGWQSIVHRDLKPQNIFLTYRSAAPNEWRFYPTPLLGDFGFAIRPNAYGASNPEAWQDWGTNGFFAPEQMEYVSRNTQAPMNPWPLDQRTNVFGVGVILYCLVTQSRSPNQAYWLGNPVGDLTYTLQDPATQVPHPHQQFANYFSQRLRGFIDACTQFNQGARPDFQQMRLFLQTTFNPAGTGESPLWTRGMRSGTATFGAKIANALMGMPPDTYRLNLQRGTIPP